jgi:SAM-dependent methyltransferase
VGLEDVERNWNAFGEIDPHWAILTGPDKAGGKWDEDEFFLTGVQQVDALLEQLRAYGFSAGGSVLDFGCGVGRVTQAFARHFDECWGVDVAASMIDGAERANRFPDRVHYLCNVRDDLAAFDDEKFDLVFSYLVLQHMDPSLSQAYVREFFRVAKVGGLLVFQLPSHVDLEPLPSSAYRASITIDAPKTMVAGSPSPVGVTVRNAGDVVWPAGDLGINVGNHWRSRKHTQFDDGRSPLLADVAPGDEFSVELMVRAPQTPGTYKFEVDLVQEGVSWFADRGSTPAAVRVKVRRDKSARTSDGGSASRPGPAPVMEMHGVEYGAVTELIAECGGSLLDAQQHPDAPPWASYRYFVRKTQPLGHEGPADRSVG